MSVPMLDDISLEYVQQIEHVHDSGFVSTRVAGLPGEVQQHFGRLSHRISIEGILFGDKAAEALADLQKKAVAGDEVSFSADITTALDLQKIVITSMRAVEVAGEVNRFRYEILLTESPPLPPPAEISPFGGLGDFGMGDLGFDTDILGDLQNLAGEVASAVDQALDVVSQLSALANLDGLQLGDFMAPVGQSIAQVQQLGSKFKDATRALGELFS